MIATVAMLIGTACASRPATVNTSPLGQCPYAVVATVRNPMNVSYDVYYQDGSLNSMLGEVRGGSTVTFPIPGKGLGRVYLRRPQGDGGGVEGRNETQVRIHCAGT
jgi:hypothetical protein